MSTPSEQIFLYGQTLDPDESGLGLLEYLDLTAGASLVFGAAVMLAIVCVFWESLTSCMVAGVKVLATVNGPLDFYATCHRGLKKIIVACLPVSALYNVYSWYFRFHSPLASSFRIWATYVLATSAYRSIVLLVYNYLYGMFIGLGPSGWEQLQDCFDVEEETVPAQWFWHQSLEALRCRGLDHGVDLHYWTDGYLPPLYDEDGEIADVCIFVLAAVLVLSLGMTALLVTALRGITLSKWWDKWRGCSAAQREELAMMAAKVETCEALLEQHRRLLTAKSEELRAAELRMDEGWALAKKLEARPVPVQAPVSKKDDEIVIRRLREMLSKTDGEIMTAHRDLKEMEANTAARERTFSIRIYQLEEQLSHERQQTKTSSSKKVQSLTAELQEQTDQLAAVKHRLAAAETREKQYRSQHNDTTKIVAQNQALVARDQEHVANNEKLAAQYKELEAGNQKLTAQYHLLVAQNQELGAYNQTIAAQYQEVVIQNKEHVANNETLTAQNEKLVANSQTLETQKEDDLANQYLADQYEEVVAENKKLAAKNKKLAGQHKELEAQNKDYDANNQKLVAQYQNMLDQNQKLTVQCQELAAQQQEPIAQNQQLAAQYQELLGQHQASVAQNQELMTQNQGLAAQYQELVAQSHELASQNQLLTTNYDVLNQMYFECEGPSAKIQQERDSALEQVFQLKFALASAESVAEEMARQAQETAAQAQKSEEILRQSMRDLKNACDSTMEQERTESEDSREQVEKLEQKMVLLKKKLQMATRDIQRADERTAAAEKAKAALEELVTKKQETTKARTGEIKSITTALEQSQVTISEQQTEINSLRDQLSQVAQGLLGPSDEVLHNKARELRGLLDTEKRQRTEDQIRWDKRVRELEEETKKLRISNSNNDAALVHRGGGRRKAVPH
ncbi:hypothetical protein BO78DRAFT_393224 [Aspergillus sclerotiicarbonarius CBS 121057]|uniref:Integral membrane protein n=1 Tax=Aspergillus sclerotiicarbonarius (strain CBS 121057 / IBT 28362) TaxID=1448318 RepID=A0A319ETD7_ASPSB|nr:hypothetical protein BO78DRAFT_393224 [Aspergillus sclerotiicarbonarius CBS 121057]